MKWLKRVLFVAVCLVTLYGLFVAVENWRGQHAWDTYQRDREAKGDTFDWKSVTPPPVPDADNFAMTPLFAELFPKPPQHPRLNALRLPDAQGADGNRYLGRVENLAAWKKCFTNDDLLAALKVYEPMMKEISEALQERPKCRYPIRYEDNVAMEIPHVTPLRNVARVYRLRALAELSAGQTDAAFEDVRLCLRLADTLKNEPVLISFLVSSSLRELAVQPIWEGLATHRWNDRQLAALQAEFANTDELTGFATVMRGERLFSYHAFRWTMKQPTERRLQIIETGEGHPSGLESFINKAWPTGWWYQNMLTIDRCHTELLQPVIDPQRRRLDPSTLKGVDEKALKKPTSPYNVLSKLLLPAFANCAKIAAASQTTVDEIIVACAVERCRLAKGALPDKLDALLPEFLAKIPTDVIDGQPLRYRREGDRFKLWSVGWNEKDDGGVVAATSETKPRWDRDKGDWVWQSWATP